MSKTEIEVLLTERNRRHTLVLQVIQHLRRKLMTTISLKVNDEDAKLIRDYATINNISLSEFIRETILDRIEDEMEMSETFTRELLQARQESMNGKLYSLEEVRKELGI